jgi:hypothetical protein
MKTGSVWSSIAVILAATTILGGASGTARAQCMAVDTGDVFLVSPSRSAR